MANDIEKLLVLLRGEMALARKEQMQGLQALIREVQRVQAQKPPVVNVSPPEVKVNVPPAKIPDIKLEAPDIKIPDIKIPDVKVEVPPIELPDIELPDVNVTFPEELEVKGFGSFAKAVLEILKRKTYSIFGEVNRDNPVPVILVDEEGNYYKALKTIASWAAGGPVASVVGVKNAAGVQVNPATEDTLATMMGFALGKFDTILPTTTTTTDVYTFKLAGNTIGTITVTYTDTTKATIQSIVRN